MNAKHQWLVTIAVLAMMIFTFSIATAVLMPVNEKSNDKTTLKKITPVYNDEDELEMVKIVFYAKPENPGKPPKPPKEDTCYKLMGVKLKSTAGYTINPSGSGMDEDFVLDTISLSAETWDFETSFEIFNDVYNVDYGATFGTQDYENVIAFGDYDDGGIGVTYVWYTRRGKAIVEFDMLFNTDYPWGDAEVEETPVMDLLNIGVHEFGHTLGMADVYSDTCNYVTMYGYSNYNDIEKRSLETPDIAGLQDMYGE